MCYLSYTLSTYVFRVMYIIVCVIVLHIVSKCVEYNVHYRKVDA